MSFYGALRSPQAIYFGSGQRHALPQLVGAWGRRVFICSDERFSQDGMLEGIAESLRDSGIVVDVYDRTIPELPLDCVLDAVGAARAFGPEVVVGMGGGSCLDIAKLVALSLGYGTGLSDFYGEFKVPGPLLPVIAVPTTAGTGSEVTPIAVLADPARETKVGISSPHLIPLVAVCDPELTLSCPPGLTAVTGADALTHAIEAFTAIRRDYAPDLVLRQGFIGKNALSDAQARVAITALAANLPAAVEDGSNLTARAQVMYGALMAGLAFGIAGTAAAHAIQYPIGAVTKTAHGLGVAALLPYVMEFNRPVRIAEFAELAGLLGVAGSGDEDAMADAAIDAVSGLFARVGIPRTLVELGLASERRPWVASQSLLSARLVNNNPRPLDLSALTAIVDAAFAGDRALLRA